MKKRFAGLVMLLALLAPITVGVGNVGAVDVLRKPCAQQPNSSVCKDKASRDSKKNPFIEIIRVTIVILSIITGVAAVFGIMISGFRMIIANGNAESIAGARRGLTYSLVGLAVVAVSQLIVLFVLDNF